jgi:hypothetical protein
MIQMWAVLDSEGNTDHDVRLFGDSMEEVANLVHYARRYPDRKVVRANVVWALERASGEYEDRCSCTIAIYSDKAKAEQRETELDEAMTMRDRDDSVTYWVSERIFIA